MCFDISFRRSIEKLAQYLLVHSIHWGLREATWLGSALMDIFLSRCLFLYQSSILDTDLRLGAKGHFQDTPSWSWLIFFIVRYEFGFEHWNDTRQFHRLAAVGMENVTRSVEATVHRACVEQISLESWSLRWYVLRGNCRVVGNGELLMSRPSLSSSAGVAVPRPFSSRTNDSLSTSIGIRYPSDTSSIAPRFRKREWRRRLFSRLLSAVCCWWRRRWTDIGMRVWAWLLTFSASHYALCYIRVTIYRYFKMRALVVGSCILHSTEYCRNMSEICPIFHCNWNIVAIFLSNTAQYFTATLQF